MQFQRAAIAREPGQLLLAMPLGSRASLKLLVQGNLRDKHVEGGDKTFQMQQPSGSRNGLCSGPASPKVEYCAATAEDLVKVGVVGCMISLVLSDVATR